MNAIVKEIEAMPADVQREALDFACFLMAKRTAHPASKTIKQRWAGALHEYRNQFSSVELQKKAQDWRADGYASD